MSFITPMLFVLLLAQASNSVQAKPNFSGTWKCVSDRSVACAADVMVVKHDGMTLAVRDPAGDRVVQTYRLDGTETTNRPAQEIGVTGRRLPNFKSVARWEKATVVIESTPLEDNAVTRKQVWQLNDNGDELTIESRSGPNPISRKTVWTKTGK